MLLYSVTKSTLPTLSFPYQVCRYNLIHSHADTYPCIHIPEYKVDKQQKDDL